MILQLDGKSIKHPSRIFENKIMKGNELTFPMDFVIIYILEDIYILLILGQLFMQTTKMTIDIDKKHMLVKTQDEQVMFDLFDTLKNLEIKNGFQTDTNKKQFKHEIDREKREGIGKPHPSGTNISFGRTM